MKRARNRFAYMAHFPAWKRPIVRRVQMNMWQMPMVRRGDDRRWYSEFLGERTPSPASASAVPQGGDAAANQG